ncbi:hypothetical protein [Nocardia asiatica]|uniref:hypothetical protein n=1 Tax=Nocardia asiatica TaxID=209252 RepID=UPI003EE0BA68
MTASKSLSNSAGTAVTDARRDVGEVLVGREAELAQIVALLLGPARLITLLGPGSRPPSVPPQAMTLPGRAHQRGWFG